MSFRRHGAPATLVVTALSALLAVPATAAVPSAGPAQAVASADAASTVPDRAIAPAGTLLTQRSDSPVAPGLNYTSFDRLDRTGWLRGDLLVADLRADLTLDYLNPGSVSGREVLSQQAERKDAIAGVNGDFFDIGDTGAPWGIGIERDADGGAGQMLNGTAQVRSSLLVGADGLGRLADVVLEGTASDDDGVTVRLTNLNSPNVNAAGIGLYTPEWGPASRTRTVEMARGVREVLVRDGVVVANTTVPADGELASNEIALIGREAGATALADFAVGDTVTTAYAPKAEGVNDIAVAVGGGDYIVRDGVVPAGLDAARHPRTAACFDADGDRMVMLTVDGRQNHSAGVTLTELGTLMRDLGCDDAINLDGGGSSTMLARMPGDADPIVVNSPSDGGERLTPNGIGFLRPQGSGDLDAIDVEAGNNLSAGPDPSREQDHRVLRGLSRVLVAQGMDESQDPTPLHRLRWSTDPRGIAKVASAADRQAVVRAQSPGNVDVFATSGGVTGELALRVLGEPVAIEATTSHIALANSGSSQTFVVTGRDADGWTTWIEPRDLAIDYDRSLLELTPTSRGFRVSPLADEGTAIITVRAGGQETHIAVSIGLTTTVVDTMDTLEGWSAVTYPAVVRGSISSAPGRNGTPGIALDYSLTGTTATRAAYVAKSPRPSLPGAPQKLGLWVNGDGKGAWLRANIFDSSGSSAKTINIAPSVDWTGWRYVEADIPSGLQMPLTFQRFYVVETNGSRQYSGRIVVDDLTVRSAPAAREVPSADPANNLVVTDGELTSRRWRFAVLSDAQFTADNTESDIVAAARTSLRQAVAENPDFVIINGDFIDRGFTADLALAKRIIDEELAGKVDYYYVPGNHESYGPGSLTQWREIFGPSRQWFDHKGVRFILRDSSAGSLRSSDFDQLLDLRAQLDDAATDDSVRHVAVVAHHPIDDPGVTGASQLSDRLEAAMLQQWLSDFREERAKGAAYISSHAGTFGSERVDGVYRLMIGNMGKDPYAAPDEGGFTGWALFGVDPKAKLSDVTDTRYRPMTTDRLPWIQGEYRAHVDELTIDGPSSARVGETLTGITASVSQDGKLVPVRYPVTADWSVSDPSVAEFSAATGELRALQPGRVTLTVTVNGVTAHHEITIG